MAQKAVTCPKEKGVHRTVPLSCGVVIYPQKHNVFLPVTLGKEHCTHFVADRRDGFCNAVRNRTKTHPLLPGTEGFFLSLFQQPASLFHDTGKHVVILLVCDNCSSDWLTSCTIWHHCLQNQHPWLQLPEIRECKPQTALVGLPQLCSPKLVTDLSSGTQANCTKSKP